MDDVQIKSQANGDKYLDTLRKELPTKLNRIFVSLTGAQKKTNPWFLACIF